MPIGERLREARLRQKIDIADVETATKIRAKYLRALENEEFGLLPGPTFVKTFLRTYAEYLGLDAQLLIEEYRVQYEPRGESEVQPITPAARRRGRERQRRRPVAPSGPPGPGTIVVVIVAALLVIFAILGLTSGGKDQGSSSGSGQTTGQGKHQPGKKKKPRKRKPAPTRVVMRVLPAVPTYICVDRGLGTSPTFNGTLAAKRTFRGKRLRINAGLRSVRLVVNGKRVAITPGATPVGFEFTPRRKRELPLGQRPCG